MFGVSNKKEKHEGISVLSIQDVRLSKFKKADLMFEDILAKSEGKRIHISISLDVMQEIFCPGVE